MNGGQHPPSSPQAPIEGGRDAFRLQARAVRRLEARAMVERRKAGDVPLAGLASLATPPPVDERQQPRRSRIMGALEAVLRRSGRTRRR